MVRRASRASAGERRLEILAAAQECFAEAGYHETRVDEIARRARGTPRVTNRLLRRVRDFVQVEGGSVITEQGAAATLERLEVDHFGLDETDRRILGTILEKFDGGPVGLDTLAAAVGEDRGTLEDVVEPYLIYQGFLDRTPRGRVATRKAREYFGLSEPGAGGGGRQPELL